MASMATHFSSTSNVHDAFLISKMDINHDKNNKIKITNLEITRELGIILEDKFKAKVGAILDM
jgi:hypothetical protein